MHYNGISARSKEAYTDFSSKAVGHAVDIPDDVSDEELVTLLTDFMSYGKNVLHDVFHSWDLEGSGRISASEFVSGMHRIGYLITETRFEHHSNLFGIPFSCMYDRIAHVVLTLYVHMLA